MPALKRVKEEPAIAVGKSNILERIYALHQESARDHVRLNAQGRQRQDCTLPDWHPLNGPAPTD